MAFKFGPFTLNQEQRQLARGTQPVHLSRKAFDLLTLLIRRRPAALAKDEIHNSLWPETFVSDGNLAVLIAEIRAALGDDSRHPTYVRTVHRVGYAFAADATEDAGGPAVPGRRLASCWLTWGNQKATLLTGVNVIGRDASADVWIDAVGLSRRHAMIVVSDDSVTLHDLESKNGTFVNDARLTSPMPIANGTEFSLGPLRIQFRHREANDRTETWDL
jgi:DNA-binding winged helix-turn-helix (wHTH) protein